MAVAITLLVLDLGLFAPIVMMVGLTVLSISYLVGRSALSDLADPEHPDPTAPAESADNERGNLPALRKSTSRRARRCFCATHTGSNERRPDPPPPPPASPTPDPEFLGP
ncbi:MAG: hypothetical protein JWQ19_2133 [Subtercola sp.]|nr:hypothetical protein [Subtercola sp.]